MAGSFELGRGELIGVDLDRALQQRGGGNEFRFDSLAGELAVEDKRIELSRLRLLAPGLKAGGELGFDAQGTASGRLAVEALNTRTAPGAESEARRLPGNTELPTLSTRLAAISRSTPCRPCATRGE
jgi:hypothetical protein